MRLQPVPGDSTRPVTDRVKEALFNIIGYDIEGASLFDLFGGTGSIGLEALSRGASFVRFIDLNRQAIATLRSNLMHTHLESGAEVIQADTLIYLKKEPDKAFDYIYIAPPQYKGLWLRVLEVLEVNMGWASKDAWIIVQIDPVEYKEVEWHSIAPFDLRRYGSTLLVFFKPRQE